MMEIVIKFISNLELRDIVSAMILLSFISLPFILLKMRRGMRSPDELMELIWKYVDKETSEEGIQELVNKTRSMEQRVANEIPKLAQTTVLRAQAERYKLSIAEDYRRLGDVTTELGACAATSGLDPEVESAILDRLKPEYEKNLFRQSLRDRIAIMSILLIVAGMLLPAPSDRFAQYVVALILIVDVIRFASSSVNNDQERKYMKVLVNTLFIAVIFILGFFGVLFVYVKGNEATVAERLVGIALLLFVGPAMLWGRWISALMLRKLDLAGNN